jgi:hypothetical protein
MFVGGGQCELLAQSYLPLFFDNERNPGGFLARIDRSVIPGAHGDPAFRPKSGMQVPECKTPQ